MAKLFSQRKGQSAIEYLTTYGWMLLVIAIVGGAIFTTVQDSANVQTVTGFSGQDVQITNFGLDSNDNLQLEMRAQASEPVDITEVTISDDDGNSITNTSVGTTLGVGNTETVKLTGTALSSADSATEHDIQVVYTSGELSDLSINGTLTGGFTITQS